MFAQSIKSVYLRVVLVIISNENAIAAGSTITRSINAENCIIEGNGKCVEIIKKKSRGVVSTRCYYFHFYSVHRSTIILTILRQVHLQ